MHTLNWSQQCLIVYTFAFQSIVCLSFILNIPFIRQISGFLFFTIIPGYFILRLFKFEKFNIIETVLLSVGLSLAFLMIMGSLANALSIFSLFSKPLASEPLFIILNISIAVIIIFSYMRNKDILAISVSALNKKTPLILCIALPIICLIGLIVFKYYNSNLLLISLMIIIPIIFLLATLSSKLENYYPIIIFSIALALLLGFTLTFKYLYGPDVALEYRVFQATKAFSFWNLEQVSSMVEITYRSMWSITILPTIYSNLLNIEGEIVFKLVYPLIFCLVPVGLFQIYQIQWGKRIAFISAIFFMVGFEFSNVMPTVNRQIIAELFFVLLLLILFKPNLSSRNRGILFMLTVFGLTVSHYATTYIFLLLMLSSFLFGWLLLKNKLRKIKGFYFAFAATFSFFWYIFIVNGAFESLSGTIKNTASNFIGDFFQSSARSELIQSALGVMARPSTLHYVGTIVHNIATLLIIIGFISVFIKRQKHKLEPDYFLFTVSGFLLLISIIIIPGAAGILQPERLYQITLIFLSPLLVIGVESLLSFLTLKKSGKNQNSKKYLKSTQHYLVVAALFLVIFSLFQSGLIYEVANDPVPSSIILSKNKMSHNPSVVHESDVFSALWLSRYCYTANTWVFSDRVSFDFVLNSYGNLDRRMISLLSNTTNKIIPSGTWTYANRSFNANVNSSYIYLSQFNVLEKSITWDSRKDVYYDFNEVPILNDTTAFINRIYSNSLSQIYYRLP